MATKYLKLRTLAALVLCGSLLPLACSGDDDDSNPTPSGGKGGKGGSSNRGGTTGDAGDNGTGGSNGGKGGKGGKGGSSSGGTNNGNAGDDSGTTGGTNNNNTGGTNNNTGGTNNNTGGTNNNTGGTGNATNNAGNGGEGNEGPVGPGCVEDDLNSETPPCYEDCSPIPSDGSDQFLNRCADGSQTLGGVPSDHYEWTGTLTALGDGCTKLGPGCVLPEL